MSTSIHTEALCWLRYGKRMPIVCTEVGPWHCDLLGLTDTMSIEVEVKKSRSDLMAEFRNKKAKHFQYANVQPQHGFVPNYLYFFVPESLGQTTVDVLKEQCPKAGVVVHTATNYLDGRNATVIKKPIKLRDEKPKSRLLAIAIQRMSSELCGTHLALERLLVQYEASLRRITDEIVLGNIRTTGVLDTEQPEVDLEARARELMNCVEGTDIFASDEIKAKWMAIAQKYLDAQYSNSREWSRESYNY